jgi:hypothetical protein
LIQIMVGQGGILMLPTTTRTNPTTLFRSTNMPFEAEFAHGQEIAFKVKARRGNVDSLMKLIAAPNGAGVELIGEGAASQSGGRGVRLKS